MVRVDAKEGEEMPVMSASEARKRLYNLVDEVKETHEPVQIVGKRSTAVLVSEDDWRAIEETLHLVSIPGMRESIRKGLETPVEECDEDPGW
jgi:prevent-host-death family protein